MSTCQHATAPCNVDCNTSNITLVTPIESRLQNDAGNMKDTCMSLPLYHYIYVSCCYLMLHQGIASRLHQTVAVCVESWSVSRPHNYFPSRYRRRETPKRPPPISIPDNHNHNPTRDTIFAQLGANAARLFRQPGGKHSLINSLAPRTDMRVRLQAQPRSSKTKFAVWTPSEADIGCFYIVMDKGLGSAASLHSAGSRGGMFHFFLACPRIFRALLRSLVLRREETTRASSADWHGSEYFRCGETERVSRVVSPWEALRCVETTVQEGRRVERASEKRSILRFDKSAARSRARRVEKQLQPASRHYFMVSYVHTSHTTSERASRPGDMARSHALRGKIASRLRWSVASQQLSVLSHARDKGPDSRRQTQADCTK